MAQQLKWRTVELGSEGIAIKPDMCDLRTDMQTVAMCGLDRKVAKLIAKAPEMAELLRGWFECYLHGTASDKTRLAEKTEKLLSEIGAGD